MCNYRRRILAALLALACSGFGAARAQASDPEGADRLWTNPGRSQLQPQAISRAAPSPMEPLPLNGLAKGVLLRKPLSDNTQLSLRLRGGRIGLYLSVQLSNRN